MYVRTKASGEKVYDIKYSFETAAGMRKKKWEYAFPTLRAAKERLDEVRVGLRRGSYVPPVTVALGPYATARLQRRFDLKAIAPSSFAGDMRLLKTHLPERLVTMPIQRLTSTHLTALYAELSANGRRDGRGGLSARTIERLHVLLSQTLKQAVSDGLVAKNVADGAERPKRRKSLVEAMTKDEVLQFLAAAKDDPFYALFYVAVNTGMRRGELCGLTWDHVHLERRELDVEQALVSVDHQPVWSTAKTDMGHRTLSLDKKTVEVLKEQKRRLAQAQLLLGEEWKDEHGLVFPNPNGSIYNPENITMRFGRLLKRAGVRPYPFHALRHTYATMARREGQVDIKVLSEHLGHSTVTITMDLYQHVPTDVAVRAAQAVPNYLFGSVT